MLSASSIVVSRAAIIGHAGGDVLQQVPVVADVLVRIPQAREERLAAAIDHGRAGRRLDRSRRADRGDLAVGDQHRAIRHDIFPATESNIRTWSTSVGVRLAGSRKLVRDVANHRGGRLVLDVLQLRPDRSHIPRAAAK